MKHGNSGKRKALAILLSVSLLLGITPAGALAADTSSKPQETDSTSLSRDTKKPEVPEIETDLSTDPVIYYQGMSYGSIVKPLSVSASAGDGGQLSYQWYSGESPDLVDKKLGKSEKYFPNVSKTGTTYYKVVVTNTLGGQTETAESAVAEIIVVPQPEGEEGKALEAESGEDVPADGYSYRTGDPASALTAVPPSPEKEGVWKYTWIYNRTNSDGFLSPRPVEGKKSFSGDPVFTPPTDSDAKFKYRCFLLLCGQDGRPILGQDGKPLQNVKTKEVPVTVARTSAADPKIHKQPLDGRYAAGTKYLDDLSVEAESTDGGRLSYQWYGSRNGGKFSPVKGATDKNFTPASSPVKADDSYYCVVTNTVKSVSGKSYRAEVQSEEAKITFTDPEDIVWKGNGTESSPYLLSTNADLILLRDRVNSGYDDYRGAFFRMTGDLTLPRDWVPIGGLRAGATNPDQGKNILPFSGTFDGGGHTLTVPEGGKPLFGYVRHAAVENLSIYGTKIDGSGLIGNYTVDYGPTGNYGDWTSSTYPDMPLTVTIDSVTLKAGSQTLESGLIDGNASGADTVRILNSTVEKGVTIGYDGNEDSIGSFAGALNGTIENCVSSADVKGKNNVGGLVGIKGQSMGNCSVRDSAFHGKVIASGTYAGGILGSGYNVPSAPNTPCVTIQNCYADGTVTGADDVGGLFGGEPVSKKCWANGIGYIQNNYFSGTVRASGAAETSSGNSNLLSRIKRVFAVGTESGNGGSHVGGIIGNMKSLDRYNVISNNYYLDSCGAQAGIGSVESVTKVPAQSTAASLQSTKMFSALSAETGDPRYGRSDDPAGADAGKLAAPVTGKQISDGSVLYRLNGGLNSSGTWVNGTEGHPVLDTEKTHMVSLTVTDYPKSCEGGSSLEKDSVSAVAEYSDETAESVSGSRMRFSGFDSSTEGYQTVSAKYQNHASLFETRVTSDAATSSGSPVTVSFRLIGATKSNGPVDLENGDYKGSRYVTWIPTKSYTLPADSKVDDLFKKAFEDAGILSGGMDGDYVSAVYAPKVCGGYKLAESANGPNSGWMYSINGSHSVASIQEQKLEDGDEIVLHYVDDYRYEVEDWFSDPKHPRLGDGTYYSEWLTAEDAGPESSAAGSVTKAAAAGNEETASSEKTASDISGILLRNIPEGGLKIGTSGGEWTVIALARAGAETPAVYDAYYRNVEEEVQKEKGVLSETRYTEYSRVILGLTAIGRDPRRVGGYDLVQPLADYGKVVLQGINGPVWALIALDSGRYDMPVLKSAGGTQNSRDKMVDFILSEEIGKGTTSAGGWALSGTEPDPDVTSMALLALSPYRDHPDVQAAVDRAVRVLSVLQKDDGGFVCWGSENSESAAQVLVSLTALGISPEREDFVKNGHSLVSALNGYYLPGKGFRHTMADSSADSLATDQCALASAAYHRFLANQNPLYDMTDAKTFSSDTTEDFSVHGSYVFKITSRNGAVPAFAVGTPGVFDSRLVRREGSDFYYQIRSIGNFGEKAGVYVNGLKLVVAEIGSAPSVISDTTAPFSVPAGRSYVFRLTTLSADAKPYFAAGTGSAFRVSYKGQKGRDYFFQVTATGKPGMTSGFYVDRGKKPAAVAAVSSK